MCPACLRTAGGPGRNDESSRADVACLEGPARRCHLRLSRLPAATTFLMCLPRSRTRVRGAGAGIRWPGCWPWDRGGHRGVEVVRGILRLDGHISIAAANRHHARDPRRTLKLLQTQCHSA